MAQWLYETGIGENRAILVEDGAILEAAIELPGAPRVGAVAPARLAAILIPGRRGLAELDGGWEAVIEPLPASGFGSASTSPPAPWRAASPWSRAPHAASSAQQAEKKRARACVRSKAMLRWGRRQR